MEKPSKNPTAGAPKTSFAKLPGNEESPWTPSSGTGAYNASSDASLFSTSLPVLPHAKFNYNETEQIGQSRDDGFPILSKVGLEDEVKDPFEDIEPSTIGSFLPGDEAELLAGFTDDFDLSGLPTQLEDLDDDFFGSGGGLEIESESHETLVDGISRLSTLDAVSGISISQYGFTNGAGAVSGEHPYGEHPSRTLFVRNINSNVDDSELKALFEDNPPDKDINQGTLVVFNLDASVSNDDLRQIFRPYGEVKEIRETPHKQHHKFIEFYDVRAAEAALKALNRIDIAGKRIKLEPSRPGGARRSFMQQLTQEQEQDEARSFLHQVGSPVADSSPGSWPNFGSPVVQNSLRGYSQSLPKLESLGSVGSNHLSGLASIFPSHVPNPVKITPIGKDPGRISHVNQVVTKDSTTQAVPFQNHFSVPDSKMSLSPRFDYSKPSSVGTLSGPQFLWGSSTIQSEHINSSSAWSSSLKGHPFPSGGQRIGFPYTSQCGSFLGLHNHVGSAPSGIQMERHFGFYPESPETSYINHAAFGLTKFSPNSGNYGANVGVHGATNIGVAFTGNLTSSGSRLMSMSRNGPLYNGSGSFGATSNDGIIDPCRSRRSESGSQMDIKKQYQLDLEKIANGEDSRTTLMIKNIPNKYTSKMLLAAIDDTHKGRYDFLYLPIDFKNKCNVGYAFINMVSPYHIVTFYEAFNGKKWEKFNSEKVASLAYARIQGKAALVSHFQNSSLMNEDKRCRPILFHSEGQGTVDLESFPSGNLNIFIRHPDGSYSGDSLDSPKGYPDATGS